ncbi:hypothetical protein [Streptomyces sp. enrichment culture]|uniref:hypothetical protein n=1 Tax=Streptomyces sp. enrichment culture TaxID=1795815 RepID=UPI003F57893B
MSDQFSDLLALGEDLGMSAFEGGLGVQGPLTPGRFELVLDGLTVLDAPGLHTYHPDHTEKDAAQARILTALGKGEKPDQEDVSTAVGESFRTLYDLGKLHLAGDRLYVLSFRGHPGFIPYLAVGITKDSNRHDRLYRHIDHDAALRTASSSTRESPARA